MKKTSAFAAALAGLVTLASCQNDATSTDAQTVSPPVGNGTPNVEAGNPSSPPVVSSPAGRIYGVTVDDVSNLDAVVTSLSKLSRRPTTRIVFDENVAAASYVDAVNRIGAVSDVMGEILDSQFEKTYTLAAHQKRVGEYLDAFGSKVKIWEIGNEINGEWLGNTPDVVAKMTDAYTQTKSHGLPTALTLYYNQDCWSNASNEMFTWAQANIPTEMKQNLDYVWVSYYEEDCNGLKPDWQAVFTKLGQAFPHSKIGFGEVGTTKTDKAAYLQRYYGLNITQPNYVGGYFWWYYAEDMVPYTQALFNTLNTAISSN